ncbi:SRPBCC family protein [Mycobacterium decipiens]|uniref:Polyketide cyclase / dehydrase and lipid transport n=1 Tax=Mycobacterium decipiens TaxID=1430326 RepID=A0A1X2LY03_9MYCO|nr:SRPBCC family protein [Mycobacterium decipiens]OSC42084.1 polyketide cyclase / dehydrase and lipid transport [Mycobacterium decipiens]
MSRWIAHVERTLIEEVPAPPEEVREFYADLDNIRLVHPLIQSVRLLARSETLGGCQRSYRVVDRIPLGPFAMQVAYHAHLSVTSHGEVHTEAAQFPRVRLYGRVTFVGTDGGTRLTERIRIAAPRPLASCTTRAAVKAHLAMLSGIRCHFESR